MTLRRFAVRTGPIPAGALRRAVPLLVGLVVVLALAALSMLLGRANLHDAEQERLAERARLTQSIGSYVTQAYAPDKLQADVARAPFSPGNRTLNELLLQQFRVTPTGDPNIVVALFDRQGRVQAARPETNGLRIEMLGSAWPAALAGKVTETQTFTLDGEVLRAYAVPVGGGSEPWSVLVAVPRDESGQQFQQRLRGLGVDGGGYSTVDATGRVLTHWQPERIGTQQFDAATMAAIRAEGFRQWTTGSGDDEVVNLAQINVNSGYAQVFSQRLEDLFSDLRASQRTQDLTVLSVLVVALLGLALMGWRRERTARRSAARVHALLKNSHDLVLVADADATLRFVSPAMEDLLGHDPATWAGRSLLDLVHAGDVNRVSAVLGEPVDSRLLNIRLITADGSVRWFDVESSDRSADPQIAGVLLTCHEVGERKDLQDRLSFQASHDELTGLVNRSVLCDRIELARAEAERRPQSGFAVLFVDLDHFKPVNDTFGHDAGDQVLRTVAARLNATIRAEDLVCRFGGDEFGILLQSADEQTACDIASRLVRAVRAPIAVNATLVHIDASIGVSLSGGPGAPGPERLIREADEAMYLAKQAGRGRYAVHSGSQGAVAARPAGAPGEAAAHPSAELVAAPASTGGRGSFPRAVAGEAHPTLRSRIQHLLPLLVAGALVVGIAGAGFGQERRAADAAEKRRVAERSEITLRVAEYAALVTDPRRLTEAVAQAPWQLASPSSNGAVLEAFSHSPAAGTNSIVALADLDGTVRTSFPEASEVSLPRTDPTFERARRGVPGFSAVQDTGGTPRAWYVLPILEAGTPRALLLIGQSARDAEVSKLMQAVGSLGYGDGGLSGLDQVGNVFVAWDKSLIGTRMLEPEDLRGVVNGDARILERDGYIYVVTPSWANGDPNRRYIVFRQPTEVFFGDLRSGQTTRNLLLVGLVCAAVLGLALLNRRRELAERRSRARLQALLHNAHDLVIALDPTGRTTFVSSAIEGLLGHGPADWFGRPFLDLVDLDDRDRVAEALHGSWRPGEADRTLADVRLLTVEADTRWFDVGLADLRDNPAVGGLLLTCHEVGERKRLQDELSHRARHDVLTGLANRATFSRHLDVTANSGRPFAVLFIDLDHFKPVNDRYGHDVGDAVLQAVAGRLESAVRSGPARPADLISRLGGDEFAIVLTGVDDADARRVADRILTAVRRPIRVGTAQVTIGATIGISFADPGDAARTDAAGLGHDPVDPSTVVQQADTAMYQAKVAGRGRYAVYEH